MILKKFLNKSFFQRLISGIILVIIAFITIVMGGNILLATIGIISLIGLFEMNKVFKIEKHPMGIMASIAVVIYYILLKLELTQYTTILIVGLLMAMMVAYVYKFPNYKTEQVMAAIFGMVYVAIMLSFIYMVRVGDNGAYNVWLIFLCSWGSDTFAYVFGVAFGKHKMAPVLSPKKTIEGGVGGVLGAALLGLIYGSIFADKINMQYVHPGIAYMVICAVGSFVSMTGDLAASAIKRNHDIKDYGKLIPGHGGIMDRFDSVIFVAPLVWLLIQFM